MRAKKTKIIWLSANKLGYELLKTAQKIKNIDLIAIITLSSKARTKMYDGIDRKQWRKFNIPVYEIDEINKEPALIKSLNPDFILMCGWRQIIKGEILKIPKKGFVGFHPTLLPEGRGPTPIINSILLNFKKAGLTMFYSVKNLDSGDIIGQEEFQIEENDYAINVYNKVIKAGRLLIKKCLPLLANNKAPRKKQNNQKATYFPKRTLKDNKIDLGDSPEKIYKKIRAFSRPYKGAYIKIGDKKLIIWKAELQENNEEKK